MQVKLITVDTDGNAPTYRVDGQGLHLEVHGQGADAVVVRIEEAGDSLHAHTRATGFVRLTETTPEGAVELAALLPGSWHQGIPSDSIVTNQQLHEPDPTELAAYGGYLVCESVDPRLRSLIEAAPAMFGVCAGIIQLLDGQTGSLHPIAWQTLLEAARRAKHKANGGRPPAIDPGVVADLVRWYGCTEDAAGYIAAAAAENAQLTGVPLENDLRHIAERARIPFYIRRERDAPPLTLADVKLLQAQTRTAHCKADTQEGTSL